MSESNRANIEIINEVCNGRENDWRLCFQDCIYHYADGTRENGYRFIWRNPKGDLLPARGQARIPTAQALYDLILMAIDAEWFDVPPLGFKYE